MYGRRCTRGVGDGVLLVLYGGGGATTGQQPEGGVSVSGCTCRWMNDEGDGVLGYSGGARGRP
jgi:hypothetical protein